MGHDLPLLPTIELKDKFTATQLEFIFNSVEKNCKLIPAIWTADGPNQGKLAANRLYWNWNDLPNVAETINSGLPKIISNNMLVDTPFILESFIPYGIHNDWFGDKIESLDVETPFYLIIIPLTTCDAKTIVLNQYGYHTHFVDYKKEHPPLLKEQQMSVEIGRAHV